MTKEEEAILSDFKEYIHIKKRKKEIAKKEAEVERKNKSLMCECKK